MKNYLIAVTIVLVILNCASCNQKAKDYENSNKIENTLKSVSLWVDSTKVSPSDLLASFERINKAIDSIGYPDAGYKLWIVQSDTNKNYRFLAEGYWPDQAGYDIIHKHQLFLNATTAEEKVWKGMKNYMYDRFILVK